MGGARTPYDIQLQLLGQLPYVLKLINESYNDQNLGTYLTLIETPIKNFTGILRDIYLYKGDNEDVLLTDEQIDSINEILSFIKKTNSPNSLKDQQVVSKLVYIKDKTTKLVDEINIQVKSQGQQESQETEESQQPKDIPQQATQSPQATPQSKQQQQAISPQAKSPQAIPPQQSVTKSKIKSKIDFLKRVAPKPKIFQDLESSYNTSFKNEYKTNQPFLPYHFESTWNEYHTDTNKTAYYEFLDKIMESNYDYATIDEQNAQDIVKKLHKTFNNKIPIIPFAACKHKSERYVNPCRKYTGTLPKTGKVFYELLDKINSDYKIEYDKQAILYDQKIMGTR